MEQHGVEPDSAPEETPQNAPCEDGVATVKADGARIQRNHRYNGTSNRKRPGRVSPKHGIPFRAFFVVCEGGQHENLQHTE